LELIGAEEFTKVTLDAFASPIYMLHEEKCPERQEHPAVLDMKCGTASGKHINENLS
jgi:hypothetical protein